MSTKSQEDYKLLHYNKICLWFGVTLESIKKYQKNENDICCKNINI